MQIIHNLYRPAEPASSRLSNAGHDRLDVSRTSIQNSMSAANAILDRISRHSTKVGQDFEEDAESDSTSSTSSSSEASSSGSRAKSDKYATNDGEIVEINVNAGQGVESNTADANNVSQESGSSKQSSDDANANADLPGRANADGSEESSATSSSRKLLRRTGDSGHCNPDDCSPEAAGAPQDSPDTPVSPTLSLEISAAEKLMMSTDSAGSKKFDDNDKYLFNMTLSQKRSKAVLNHVFRKITVLREKNQWMRDKLTANGLSYSRRLNTNKEPLDYNDPTQTEDKKASRRIEIKLRTKAREIIKELRERY